MTFSITKPAFQTKQMVEELHHMLTYMRPAGTTHEQEFVSRFVDTLPGVFADDYGNRHVVIGNTNMLWSSHTDSVHHQTGRQVVIKRDGVFRLKGDQPKKPSCLGADCATGVWIMRNMILRGVPGHYAFHRDEEIGGCGSSWIAKNDPGLLEGVEIAVAFDRKGYDSVITHQGSRTASDEFARSMAGLLGDKYMADDTGIFTDTAKYASIIPECSNLSVGYHQAHSAQEWQDIDFAVLLLDKVTHLDTSKLVVARDPKVVEYSGWGGRYSRWTDHYDWSGSNSIYDATTPPVDKSTKLWGEDDEDAGTFRRSTSSSNYDELYEIVLRHPDVVADWLDGMGLDADDLSDVLWRANGR